VSGEDPRPSGASKARQAARAAQRGASTRPQHEVKPAASTDEQSGAEPLMSRRRQHRRREFRSATLVPRVWGAARVQGEARTRETRLRGPGQSKARRISRRRNRPLRSGSPRDRSTVMVARTTRPEGRSWGGHAGEQVSAREWPQVRPNDPGGRSRATKCENCNVGSATSSLT